MRLFGLEFSIGLKIICKSVRQHLHQMCIEVSCIWVCSLNITVSLVLLASIFLLEFVFGELICYSFFMTTTLYLFHWHRVLMYFLCIVMNCYYV